MVDLLDKPLLRPDSIAREINAVNSEHLMNRGRDYRRSLQIFYSGLSLKIFKLSHSERR